MRIAVLGWGSLLWDKESDNGKDFARHLKKRGGSDRWCEEGPTLRLEFSRVSESRGKALTLVLDYETGAECQVAYRISERNCPEDAVCDLRQRESTRRDNIGLYLASSVEGRTRWANAHTDARKAIEEWARSEIFEAVVWTALESNFMKKAKQPFSTEAALDWIKNLDPEGKAKAAEYIWRAPTFIKTDLRDKLQVEPWFRRSTE